MTEDLHNAKRVKVCKRCSDLSHMYEVMETNTTLIAQLTARPWLFPDARKKIEEARTQNKTFAKLIDATEEFNCLCEYQLMLPV